MGPRWWPKGDQRMAKGRTFGIRLPPEIHSKKVHVFASGFGVVRDLFFMDSGSHVQGISSKTSPQHPAKHIRKSFKIVPGKTHRRHLWLRIRHLGMEIQTNFVFGSGISGRNYKTYIKNMKNQHIRKTYKTTPKIMKNRSWRLQNHEQ